MVTGDGRIENLHVVKHGPQIVFLRLSQASTVSPINRGGMPFLIGHDMHACMHSKT